MKSLAYIPASNQAANASLMTVQTVRASGASDIIVNTITGAPTKFYASMGAPHTFIDPATGETITIISEATAVDFAGHLDSGKVVIDAIAPGYVDTRGSLVGDIVVIRPVTEWANNIFNVLSESHNDDGTLKSTAYTFNPNVLDHVASGAVIAGLGYGSTLTASLSAGVVWINGFKQTIAAVASRAYTASKDTYVDALYNANGTATIVYTEVANSAASPALAANSHRLGIVVSGANIASAASINQGQTDRVLPISGGFPYVYNDSLGNRICRRNPVESIKAYSFVNRGGNIISGGAYTTNVSIPIVATGRSLIIEGIANIRDGNSGAARSGRIRLLMDGNPISDTDTTWVTPLNATGTSSIISRDVTPASGVHTFALQTYADTNSASGLWQASLKVTEP